MATMKFETIKNVTAYADACLGGFNGTYQEWCELIATVGTNSLIIPVDPALEPSTYGAVWITTK